MRRYELRILPLHQPGTYPPFHIQHRDNPSSPYKLSLGTKLDSSSADESSTENLVHAASLRQIRSRALGQLVTIKGMIVRASDVKPACTVATYTCDDCGCEIIKS
jgi:DNA replicative helicase MCM subunit Mcm2 (Cdc46/Mcm family)